MRILVTIPHFFRNMAAGELADAGQDAFGSFQSGRERRLACLNACLEGLLMAGGALQYELNHTTGVVGSLVVRRDTGWRIDVLLAVHGEQHLADSIDHRDAVQVVSHDALHPKLLGYACHEMMAERRGAYDLYVYLEDDLVIGDPDFFAKQRWFRESFGPDAGLLQPNRYEIGPKASRIYVDGDLPASVLRRDLPPGPDRLTGQWLNRPLLLDRRNNPLSGGFVLSAAQLDRWAGSPIFRDRDQSFIGTLESAQILGPMKLFPVYKPAFANPTFLEVRHADARLSALPAARRALSNAIP